jgi:1-acyl-sn-glycerol-3-phosphate acyltransferase
VSDASTPVERRRRWWPVPAEAEPTEHRLTGLIRTFAFGARLIARAVARARVEGLEHLPASGPLILAPNHASNADPVVVGALLTPRLGRRIHWFSKREVLEWPVLGWIGRAGGVHGIERGAADVEGFRTAMKVLESGGVLLVFPEGTRSPTGALQEAKDGLATLAIRSGAAILPIGIAGSHRVWPKGGRPRLGHRITMRIGEPFRPADAVPDGADRRTAKGLVTRTMMRRIAALLPPSQRGVYADP